MSKVTLFFKRNVHIFAAVSFIVLYLCLSVVFMLFGFDGILSTIFSNIVVSVVGIFYIRCFFKPNRNLVTAGYAGVMMCLLVVMWLFSQITATWVLNHIEDTGFETYQTVVDVNPGMYIILALIFAPIAEEILFRGIVFNGIKSRFPVWVAYIVSSLGFAIMHGTIIHMVIGFVCGMVFAMAYEYTGSISWSIALHCIYNFMSVFLAGITVPDLFFNPVVFLSVDVLIMFAIWRECRRVADYRVSSYVQKRPAMPELDCDEYNPTKQELIRDSEHEDDIVAGSNKTCRVEHVHCHHVNSNEVSPMECESYGMGNCYLENGCCPYDKSE